MFNAPEADVVTKPRLEKVKQAGKAFGENGAVSDALLEDIAEPMIPNETYIQIVNGNAH